MVSAHAYPTFELSDAAPLLAKTAARERKLRQCLEIPYCPEIPSLTLTSLKKIQAFHVSICPSEARPTMSCSSST